MFLHGGPIHILFNMLGIWMFGVELERMWRTRLFLKYYAITGIGAGLTVILVGLLPFATTAHTYDAITIGASGALYGLLMAYAYYFPDRPLLMFLLFPIPAKYFVAIVGAMAFLSAPNSQVSEAAHLGGLIIGYLYLRGGRGGIYGRDQVPLPEVEDEPAPPQVRRVFGRPIRLGQARSLSAGRKPKRTSRSAPRRHTVPSILACFAACPMTRNPCLK